MARLNPRVAIGGIIGLICLFLVYHVMSVKEQLSSKPVVLHRRRPDIGEEEPSPVALPNKHSFYSLRPLDSKHLPFPFEKLRDKVVLIVNVASQDQKARENFAQLQALQDKYFDRGFTVVAFPCNQFSKEEPGSDIEINNHLVRDLHVTFPVLAKVDVNGGRTSPVFRFLKISFPGMIKWNFTGKFLISKSEHPLTKAAGKVLRRTRLSGASLEKDIEAALQAS